MSADSNLKLSFSPRNSTFEQSSAAAPQPAVPPERICGYCELRIPPDQPPVLLKSGHALHLDCYLFLQKHQTGDRAS
jgi:hypothetical protein